MRITEKDLQAAINHLNRLTGSPLEYAYRDAEGKLITNPCHFHLAAAFDSKIYWIAKINTKGIVSFIQPYKTIKAAQRGFEKI